MLIVSVSWKIIRRGLKSACLIMRHNEADEILKIVSDLQSDHEADRESPWDMASANQDFIHELVKHVVGFTVEIRSVEAKFKLEQKQSASDRRATIDDLRRSGRPDDLAIATQIERFL